MWSQLNILKGVHPGAFLERELKKRGLGKGAFALSVREYPQTLSAILNGKRSMNTSLALRIEEALGMEEGFLMTLQVFYDIEQEKVSPSAKKQPALSKLRPALFWETTLDRINWDRQKRAVINRVFERGNEEEQGEIIKYYGQEMIDSVLQSKTTDR